MLSIVAGQAMALRGPEGSMDLAVRHMERQNRRALRKFGRGLFAFCLSFTGQAAMFIATLEPIKAAIMITVGCWTIHTLLRYGLDIQAAFSLGESTVVRATWSGDNQRAMCEQSDRGEASASALPEGGRDLGGNGICGHGAVMRPEPAAAEPAGALKRGALPTQSPGCWPLGLLPILPLWRMDKLLPFAYNNGPPAVEERANARERYQQAVAVQILQQQRLAPDPIPVAATSSDWLWFDRMRGTGDQRQSTSSSQPLHSQPASLGWLDHLRGQFQSAKEPLLPL